MSIRLASLANTLLPVPSDFAISTLPDSLLASYLSQGSKTQGDRFLLLHPRLLLRIVILSEAKDLPDHVGCFALGLVIGAHQQFRQQAHHDALHTEPRKEW